MPASLRPSYSMDPLESRLLLSGRVVGYFPEYRWSTFSNIDFDALTHVNYFSVSADSSGSLSTGNINLSHMATLITEAHSHGVGVSITVGPQSFSTIAASTSATNAFVDNIVTFATVHGLDGIDLDWEPTPTSSNIARYGSLINALHAQTSPLGLKLTAAVNPWNKEIPLAATAKMDWLNVMCYDFAPNNHSTYAAATDAMLDWADYGVPRDKLVMGVPFYGRQGSSWSNTTARTYGAIVNDYLVDNGSYPSADADFLDGWYFNGKTTIRNKAQFVVDESFGGVMIWELGQDHFVNGQYTSMSLLPVIKDVIQPGDVIAPAVQQASFHFETSPHRLSFQFSEDVGASLSVADLVVRDVDTQAQIIVTGVSYDADAHVATFTLIGVLPDGNYRATLSGAGIQDPAGNPLGADFVHDLFFLNGDANHDGRVNLDDFNILANNFGQSNSTFGQGDFTYDGTVDLADFNVFAARFGTVLADAQTARTAGERDVAPGRAAGTDRTAAPVPARSSAAGRGSSAFASSRISADPRVVDLVSEDDQPVA